MNIVTTFRRTPSWSAGLRPGAVVGTVRIAPDRRSALQQREAGAALVAKQARTVFALFLSLAILPQRPVLLAAEAPRLTPLVAVDFTKPGAAEGWHAQHGIASLQPTAEGLRVKISGDDPYFAGPAFSLPAGVPLMLHLRVRSDVGGTGQVFYFRDNPKPDDAVNFSAKRGEWQDVRIKLPALGPGYHFRIDPPGDSGTMVLASLRVEARPIFPAPKWAGAVPYSPAASDPTVRAGELVLQHSPATLGAWQLTVAGTSMATVVQP